MTVKEIHLQFNKEIEARKEDLEEMLVSFLNYKNKHTNERDKKNIHPLHSRELETNN